MQYIWNYTPETEQCF